MNSSKKRYKVAVVGAGIAGLTCAQTLVDYGLDREDILVLEARDRVGGRVLTQETCGAAFDHGAAWIHGTLQNPLAIALERRGVVLQQVSPRNPWMIPACMGVAVFSHGRRLDEKKRREMLTVFQGLMDKVEELVDEPCDKPQSLAEALMCVAASMPDNLQEDERTLLEANALLIEAWNGGSIRDLEAMYFFSDDEDEDEDDGSDGKGGEHSESDEDHDFDEADFTSAATTLSIAEESENWGDFPGPHCLPVGGMQQLLRVVASDEILADVKTGAVVTRVLREDAGASTGAQVTIECADQQVYHAERVVMTLPLGVLQSNTVTFSPPLPEQKVEAISRLRMGAYKKVILRYAEPFWPADSPFILMARSNESPIRTKSFEGVALRKLLDSEDTNRSEHIPDLGPILLFDNYLNLKGLPVLEAVCVAEQGFLLTRFTDEVVVRAVTQYVRANFPDATDPVESHVTRWEEDPFSRGAYSFFALGARDTDVLTVAEPVDSTIYFAGECFDLDYQGSVNAAHNSGLRAAATIRDDQLGMHDDVKYR